MRILHIDVDSLRPDHLGAYGYSRDTSPNIDALARDAFVFTKVYASDVPCLPSRTALWSGRFGYHTGVANHGGVAAQPRIEGASRGFRDQFWFTGWMAALRKLGCHTATISSFGERHCAWHWYAGFNDIVNPGRGGVEPADEVAALALDWLGRRGERDNWYLHVNFWDPHTPYNAPAAVGEPFAGKPLPEVYGETFRLKCWDGFGPHSAREPHDFSELQPDRIPARMPAQIDSMASLEKWINGYDTGVWYMDKFVGQLVDWLAQRNLLGETAIIISGDHGENLGELNVWGDHQTADYPTCRVPLIVRWPGLAAQSPAAESLHYQFDWAATMIELCGGVVPENWDGKSFAGELKSAEGTGPEISGRPYLILSQQAWSCQRSVRFGNYLFVRTNHDGYKDLPPTLLFNVKDDPYEQNDLAGQNPDIVFKAEQHYETWLEEMRRTTDGPDPMEIVLSEGGPYHCRGFLENYLKRLTATGRAHHADALRRRHPAEITARG